MAAGDMKGRSWISGTGGTTLLLSLFFLLALFIRTFFNFDASFNGGNWRWSGTDAYYHMRVVDHIRETGSFLLLDPLINYPIGAFNPRPPLFDWLIAAAGGILTPFFGGDQIAATDHAAAFSPAVWGALTIFPMYFIGKEAFGRRAGLWAAFFIAVMAAHITRSNLGAVDHDATILFFFTLGAWSFVKSLKLLDRSVYVDDWRRSGQIGPGFARVFRDNKASIAYALFTGASFAAVALTWQGFPYLFAVLAAWYGFQLLSNHLRRVDSLPHMVLTLVVFLTTLVMVAPYYSTVSRFDLNVMPMVYILLGVLVASLVFVPTRHLPPVVVLPATIGAGALGILILLVVFPDIGRLFFTGLGYFVQTKLYSTIAEAQRTPLGYLVFSIGVLPFFFALAGIGFAIASFVRKRRNDHLFVLVWAAVALLMAFTATRFVFNASVGFAVLAGWVTDRFVTWVRFGEAAKTWRNLRESGTGLFKTSRQAIGIRHVLSAIVVVFLLLIPSVWAGIDAGMPAEYVGEKVEGKDEGDFTYDLLTHWFGAFGQDFLSAHWIQALNYLAQQDQDVPDLADRPAFVAWWDYGFYAVNRGDHPTVADPFQFGYQISGRVLASQSEAEAINFFSIRLIEGNIIRGQESGGLDANVAAVLDERRPGLADDITQPIRHGDYDEAYEILVAAIPGGNATAPSSDEAVDLYADLRAATGHSIRYLTLDGRMFPCDDPRTTTQVDSGSIFYAPVFLADKNPEDFVRTYYDAGNVRYYQKIYETTPDGGSRAVETPHAINQQGDRFVIGGGQLFPMAANGHIDYTDPLSQNGVGITGQGLEYQERFYDTLLYRAWVGPAPENLADNLPSTSLLAPGQGLEHFRLVFTTVNVFSEQQANLCTTYAGGGVTMLKYYEGAPVTGTVRDDEGNALVGATVRVADNFGIVHDAAIIGENGTFSLSAPFSTENDPAPEAATGPANVPRGVGPNRLEVVVNGELVQSENFTVTDDQAMRVDGAPTLDPIDVTVQLGSLTGLVYHDVDGDGSFNPANDTAIENANITIGSKTTQTDASGNYTLTGIQPGSRSVRAVAAGFANATVTARVPSGAQGTADIGMQPAPITVRGMVVHNGAGVGGATIDILPQGENTTLTARHPVSDAGGNYTVQLPPGTWLVSVNHTALENNATVRYTTAQPIEVTVAMGDATRSLDIEVMRSEE